MQLCLLSTTTYLQPFVFIFLPWQSQLSIYLSNYPLTSFIFLAVLYSHPEKQWGPINMLAAYWDSDMKREHVWAYEILKKNTENQLKK